jgi:DNA (cytosine-5)-methyltransferase 1
MKVLSLFSGMEAASVALNPIGFNVSYFSEINPNCNKFLRFKYPDIVNLGGINNHENWNIPEMHFLDMICGGSPCQSFSAFGNRKGFGDSNGQLAFKYFEVVSKFKPTWFMWENVPGILTSNGGSDFAKILNKVAECGYSAAWRVFDAKNFGVPQMRRRLFLVGHRDFEQYPIRTLFDTESEIWDVEKNEETKKATTAFVPKSSRGTIITNSGSLSYCLNAGGGGRNDLLSETFVLDTLGIRKLSIEECLKLQGFPVDYFGSFEAGYFTKRKMIGNSWAIPVVSYIGQKIYDLHNKNVWYIDKTCQKW